MEGGNSCRWPEWEEERSEEENSDVEDYYDGGNGVIRAHLIQGSKHRDRSIYRKTHTGSATSTTSAIPARLHAYLDVA
jgi:hypothetical protein